MRPPTINRANTKPGFILVHFILGEGILHCAHHMKRQPSHCGIHAAAHHMTPVNLQNLSGALWQKARETWQNHVDLAITGRHYNHLDLYRKYGIRICLSPLEDHPKSIHLFWVLSLPLPLHHQAEGSAKAEGELYIFTDNDSSWKSNPFKTH